MKLYATISSERATKGQGGNKDLKIEITVGNERKLLASMEVKKLLSANGIEFYHLQHTNGDIISETAIYPTSKGNKQKGEDYKCDACEFVGATSKELHEHYQDHHGLEIE